MEINETTQRFTFKLVDGLPCLAWPMPPREIVTAPPDDIRESAFADFPNINTPAQLVDVYKRLAYLPIYPRYIERYLDVDVVDITRPETLLEEFGLTSTRKNLKEVIDLLDSSYVHSEAWAVIPVSDCLMMSRDMKALLTVLAFSYGLCNAQALMLNTRYDFAFTYEFRGVSTPYGEFILQVREDDPQMLLVDHETIHEDIQSAAQSKDGRPASRIIKSMQGFAEGYINGFMWSVHPILHDGKFTSASKGNGLCDIYTYWAQRSSKGKILACANCGKLVANPRKGQMYCSKSCKVQACRKAN